MGEKKLYGPESEGDLRVLESGSGRDFQRAINSHVKCTGEAEMRRRNI